MTNRRCLTCAHASLRDPKDATRDKTLRAMAASGAVCCGLSVMRASFVAFGKCCERWLAARPDVTAGRIAWAERRA